MSDKKNH